MLVSTVQVLTYCDQVTQYINILTKLFGHLEVGCILMSSCKNINILRS